jgi:hypothetical protein
VVFLCTYMMCAVVRVGVWECTCRAGEGAALLGGFGMVWGIIRRIRAHRDFVERFLVGRGVDGGFLYNRDS